MNLKSYLTPLLKYWWLLLAAALVASISSAAVTSQQPPIYQAHATMVVGRAIFEPNPQSVDLWLGQQLASYYADIAQRSEIYNATMKALNLPKLPQYAVVPLPNSQMLEITVTDTNPVRAQAVANELANQLVLMSPASTENQGTERQSFVEEQITYLEQKIRETLDEIDTAEQQLSELNSARQIADTQNQISALQGKLAQLQSNYAALIANTQEGAANQLSIIEPATLPTEPIGPQRAITIILSAMIAMAVAAMAAYLLEFLDDTFKSAEDITDLLHIPVLATIPVIGAADGTTETPRRSRFASLSRIFPKSRKASPNHGGKSKLNGNGSVDTSRYLFTSAHPRSATAEEFRMLRINLDFAGVDKALKSVYVTSPDPADGKTSVATNLAIVMAQSGRKVLLIDADFRKPSVDEHFSLPNESGLSDIFRDSNDITRVAQHWGDSNLWVVTTGLTPPNPVDLLSSNKLSQMLEEMKLICDIVVIDGPPLIFPDSIALSTKVDGVLVVISHALTRKGHAVSRLKQLEQARARVLGAVLNRAPKENFSYYSSSSHYHRYYRPEKKTETEVKNLN